MEVAIVSYNGSGTFQINTSGQPVVAGTVISATAFNALTADLATGLSTAITKDGQTTTTARIPFAAGINSTLTTDSSSVSTGSIITAGGVGVAKNLYVGVNANVAGTLGVTGVATFSAAPIYSSLTASSAVATDASKNLVSVTNTGTGNNVLATSPTLVTPNLGTPTSGILTNCTGINYDGFKNRIINGAMVIDQRNAGALITPAVSGFIVDRWGYYQAQASKGTIGQNAGSVTPPTGYSKYLGFTSTSAYSVLTTDQFVIYQKIEGFNTADLAWGTASAATVTLSFWVRSSLTGTFGGTLQNSAQDRAYPFNYTISSANTWEQKTVTVAGDTTGTWVGATNGTGLQITFGLGSGATYSATAGAWTAGSYSTTTGATSVVGTNGATFYITGVQLEKGSTATSFDYRPYGTELALCQRYLPAVQGNTGDKIIGVALSGTRCNSTFNYQVTPRTPPTGITVTTASNFGTYIPATTGGPTPTAISFNAAGIVSASINVDVASGFTAGQFVQFFPANSSAQILFTGCEL